MSKAADSGDILSFTPKLWAGLNQNNFQPVVLVAKNKREQKMLQEWYPGIEVVLQSEYTGYPLPTDATRYLGVQDLSAGATAEEKKND